MSEIVEHIKGDGDDDDDVDDEKAEECCVLVVDADEMRGWMMNG